MITQFPVQGYTNIFYRLLFESEVIEEALNMLTSLNLLNQPSEPCMPRATIMKRRYRVWEAINRAAIPPVVRGLRHEILISGIYESLSKFFEAARRKARQDVYLQLK